MLAKTTTRSYEGVKELVMATLRAAQAPEADIQRVMERLQSSGRMDEEVGFAPNAHVVSGVGCGLCCVL